MILIMAILAAVAIPVFLRQRQKGYENLRSALKNAATAIESYAIDKDGDYGGLNAGPQLETRLAEQGFLIPDWAKADPAKVLSYFRVKSNQNAYCIEARDISLTAASDWRRSVYRSWVGEPTPTPDSCPNTLPSV